MNDAEFLEVIRANPDNATLALVYADWLDDQDDPRGELIRLHVEVSTDLTFHPKWKHYLSVLKHVYGTNRFTALVEGLDQRQQRLLTCQIANSVLFHYEAIFPNDTRLRRAVELSRAAGGKTREEEPLRRALTDIEAAIKSAWEDAFDRCGTINLTGEYEPAKRAIRAAVVAEKAIRGALGMEASVAQNASLHAAKSFGEEGYANTEAKHLTWVVNRHLGFQAEHI